MANFSLKLVRLFLMLATVNVDARRFMENAVRPRKCTTDINTLKNVCYWYEATRRDQPSALQVCESHGGTLAVIDSLETATFVREWNPADRSGVSWIGYNSNDGNWYDGSVFNWTNWCAGEPSSEAERCIEIRHKSNDCWNDRRCNNESPSICQKSVSQTRAHAQQEKVQVGTPTSARGEQKAENILRCTRLCLQDPLCGKFNFHPTTRLCALYAEGALVNEADGSQTFTL